MDYDVLCKANVFDEAGAPLMLRLVHVNDVFDSQPFKVVAPNEDFIKCAVKPLALAMGI